MSQSARHGLTGFLVLAVMALSSSATTAADGQPDLLPRISETSAAAVAGQIDTMISGHLSDMGVSPAALTNDEDFLRRVTLDLVGRIPSPQDVTLFGLTPDKDKRAQVIDGLLDTEDFARTWASYWREVVYSRATEVRSRISQPVFETWLTGQFDGGAGWDSIATEILTATGNTREQGSTGLIFAQGGDPKEIAAEVSRIFLGIQIQCANCHDHPYDQWKREDFHELAAFFPRIRLRRDGSTQPATFLIDSADDERRRRGQALDVDQLFRFLDRNRDGRLTQTEAQRSRQFGQRFQRIIQLADKNADGALTREELKELPQPQAQPGRGMPEYYMPDLDNPAEQGTLTEPVFFVNDRSVSFGTDDLDRRGALAKYITSPLNPWFARSFVNRIWAEMLGEGFYSPVDDMGPERSAQYADVLDVLAAGFAANAYDVKWVYRTIALTDAYQRSAALSGAGEDSPSIAAASTTRLRGDQIYNALTQVLGVKSLGNGMARGANIGALRSQTQDVARFAFGQLFNYDPSTPQVDLMGDIPQALFMMNSGVTSAGINGRGPTALGRILRQFDDDEDALSELYLRVLAREPTESEAAICHEYIAKVGDRTQAFEDVMWSLMNSTEFLTKR